MRMRSGLRAGAVAALALLATGAEALPLAPLATGAGSVVLVRDGCGPDGHRSHYGYCKFDGPRFFRPPPPDGPPAFYGPPRHFGPPPRFYGGYAGDDGPVYRRPRCFIRETYDGPVRVCR